MKKSLIDRRKFIKKVGLGLEIGVTGIVFGSIAVSLGTVLDSKIRKKKFDPSPGEIVDTTIEDIPFKLHGMTHCREFAEKYSNSLDSLVKNASIVVSEANPDDLESDTMPATVRAYFRTTIELCQKYDKSLIYLDPLTQIGMTGETCLGLAGGLLAMGNASRITRSITKRKFIKNSLKTVAGLYLFMSSFVYGNSFKELTGQSFEQERFYYNHVVDQRNVEIANRLLKLPNLLRQDDLNKGDYVLVDYGRGHLPGIMHYLKNPIRRGIKTAMYALTYDLVDSEKIVLYKPNGKSWERERLVG